MVVYQKKQKNVKQGSSEESIAGDAWIYTCIKRGSCLFVAYAVGKWTQETCRRMIDTLYDRVQLPSPDDKIELFSDGNDDYEYILPEYYPNTCMVYGQLIKIRKGGKVVDKIKRIISGFPDPEDIETTEIENFNGILRERIGRLVRKTKCHAKKKTALVNVLAVFQFYWNFMDLLSDTKKTPAMFELLADKVWSWDDFLLFHYAL